MCLRVFMFEFKTIALFIITAIAEMVGVLFTLSLA